jgi:TonB-dependent starch-binding outer membrane protein SusC
MRQKLTFFGKPKPNTIAKALLTMKLIFLLIIAGVVQASANVNGQNKISLKLDQVQINQVLSNIEKQSNYRFLYNNQLKDLQQKVSINMNDEDVAMVLKTIFTGTGLTYRMLENNLIVVLSATLTVQDIRITGKVTSDAGDPLSGVSVTLKGTARGTATNNNGEFELTAPEDGTLVISYIGYQTQEVAVKSQAVVNIKMVQSEKPLDQVVVVGYGTQRKIDVTGSVAHIKGDELAKQPVLTATQAIQGKVAGVQVISSGQPGSSPQVIIRGTGSILAGANPLLIVDGIWTDDISNINTADILSLDVLKDASACSIYGVRGANGVILITTRQGSGKMKVTYSTNMGIQQAAHVVPMANATQYLNYQQAITGLPTSATGYSTNWYNEILRNAFYQNHNASVSGSNEQDKYALSISYQTNEGIIIFNKYSRYTIRFNNELTPTSFLKIGTTASFANQASQNIPTGTITEDAYRAAPVVPAVVKGKFGNTSQYQNVGNPVLDAQNTNDLSHDNRLQGNIWVEVKPVKSISFKSTFNDEVDFNDDRQYTYEHPNDTTFFNVNGGSQGATRSTLAIDNGKYHRWVWSNTINFSKEFGNSRINVLVGTEAQEYYNVSSSASRYSVPPIPSEWYIQDGDANFQFNGGSVTKYTTNSYFGRLFYSYADKYLFTANFRADGSSVFAAANRWGYFPGLSAGWVISKENFMDNQHIFQFLKLKGSWGELGNSLIPPDAAVYTNLSNLPYFFNSGNTGSNPTTATIVPVPEKNLNLKWEVTKEADLGVEYSILKGKLTGEMDVYDKKVTDALIYVGVQGDFGGQNNPLSSIPGTNVIDNAATIDNKGFEFSARWHDNINKNLSYFIGANASLNRNRVVSLNGGLPLFDGNINGYYTTETKPGYPIGAFFMRQVIGVFQNQTQIDGYVDKNGNQLQPGANPGDFIYKFNPNGKLDTAYLGSYQPKAYFGLSAGFNYKNLDFSVDVYSNVGNQVYNGKQQARVANRDNLEESVATSYWTPQDKSETQPSANGGNLPASSYFLASGTFVRINNITLGYSIPSTIINRQKIISGCRIFLTAQNPVTLKKYNGFSSELPGSSPTNAGIELSTYPTTRTFTFGINLSL